MNKQLGAVRVVMTLAGVYDGVLGAAFLFFARPTFDLIQTPPPEHLGYVQFAAALLVVFALMFFAVAVSPVRYQAFITAGMGLKVAYIGVVAYHSLTQPVPAIWVWFAGFDVLWLLLFIVIRARMGKSQPAA